MQDRKNLVKTQKSQPITNQKQLYNTLSKNWTNPTTKITNGPCIQVTEINEPRRKRKKKEKKKQLRSPFVLLAGFPVGISHGELIEIREQRCEHGIGRPVDAAVARFEPVGLRHSHFWIYKPETNRIRRKSFPSVWYVDAERNSVSNAFQISILSIGRWNRRDGYLVERQICV